MKLRTFKKFDLILLIISLVFGGLLGLTYMNNSSSFDNSLSFMFFPLLVGLVLQDKTLGSSWSNIFRKVSGAFILSFFAFIPGKRERIYSLENHLELWPFFFIGFFLLLAVAFHDKKKITMKISEGTTFLQSIVLIYWFSTFNYKIENIIESAIFIIGLVFIIISFFHAFSKKIHTRKSRLYLSIWSSLILMIFSVNHIYEILINTSTLNDSIENILISSFQYFILGISLIFTFQNVLMLIEYIPSRNRFYNKEHMKDIKKMNNDHIKRYSNQQVKLSDSLIVLIFSTALLYSNVIFQVLKPISMIWFTLWIIPMIMAVKNKITMPNNGYK